MQDVNMTEEEMRERMKEIDKERDQLRKEKTEYENYFRKKENTEKFNKHKEFEGKHFKLKSPFPGTSDFIRAFKVLKVLDFPNENYAECLVLSAGIRGTCWEEQGIQIMTIGLWNPAVRRLMRKDSDPEKIDAYQEISAQEFKSMYMSWDLEIKDIL